MKRENPTMQWMRRAGEKKNKEKKKNLTEEWNGFYGHFHISIALRSRIAMRCLTQDIRKSP